MRPLLWLLLLAPCAAASQTPDTTPPESYWPLAVGNEWHWLETYTNGYSTSETTTLLRQRVDAEHPTLPGRYITSWERIRSSLYWPTETASGVGTMWFDPATQQVEGASTPCPLGAALNTQVACEGGSQLYYVTGGPGQSVSVGGQAVVAPRKEFRHNSSGPGLYTKTYVYAAGIGELSYVHLASWSGGMYDVRRSLRYARIDGTGYGTPMFTVAAEDVPGAALVLTLGPNPASGTSTARFALAAPADVRVAVLDALGRTVAVAADGPRGAGPHAVPLPGGLAPGLYLVRLEADGLAATRRLTVAR